MVKEREHTAKKLMVLTNIQLHCVDVEGNVNLRGNENVRVLIDGKAS
jgi:hypothetical protein